MSPKQARLGASTKAKTLLISTSMHPNLANAEAAAAERGAIASSSGRAFNAVCSQYEGRGNEAYRLIATERTGKAAFGPAD